VRLTQTLAAVETHAEGEQGTVYLGSVFDIPGATAREKLQHVNEVDDRIRRFLCFEPRGRSQASANIVFPSTDPEADAGFIILQADRAHAMSGSNTICVVTALLETGTIPMREPGVVEDVEIGLALPDLLPLGAGGGSIASVSDDGVLRVGPQSAGAYPGPACFGRGGSEPTVTDADVVLGILRPEAFLGGRIKIDADAAAAAMRPIGEQLGVETDDVAERILQTVNAEMGARLADIARSRDVDPAQATILAFGGNGATHAAGIAEQAGIREVMVLPIAAVFSAFGTSTATIRHLRQAPSSDGDKVALRELVLRDMRSEGFTADEVEVAVHEDEHAGEPWLVAEAVRQAAPIEMPRYEASSEPALAAGQAEVRWPGAGRVTTDLYRREDLRPGATLVGPALVEAPETTCAVPPGWTARLDERGALCLRREEVGS